MPAPPPSAAPLGERSDAPAVSAVLITLDAAAHLDRCLTALADCVAEIVVVDCGSTDATRAIAERHGARFIHHDWSGFGPQKRFAVAQARYDWVLAVDADEVLDAASAAAIRDLPLDDAHRCWAVRRRTYVGEREVRFGHWHPDRVIRLFNRTATDFTAEAVHESVPPTARPAVLPGCLHHYSFTDLAAIFRFDYHRLKAERYRREGRRAGSCLLLLRAAWAFVRSYLLKQGFRDGQAGIVVALSGAVNAVQGLAMASWEQHGADNETP